MVTELESEPESESQRESGFKYLLLLLGGERW